MELLRKEIKVSSRSDIFRVYFFYDLHNGAAGCDHDLMNRQLNHALNDNNGYAYFGGDMAEFIKKADRRHNASAVHPMFRDRNPDNIIGAQYAHVKRLIKPFAQEKKLLGVGLGNHEWNYATKDDFHFIAQLCEEEDFSDNVPYAGYSCVISLVCKRGGSTRNVLINAHDAAVQMMDDEIREELHRLQPWKTEQQFFTAYEKAHAEKYDEEWELSKANPTW